MLSNGRPLPSRPTSFRVVSMLMIMVTIQRSPRATPFFRIASKNIEIPMILSSMKKILKAQNRRVIEFYAPFISTRGGQSWLKPVISRARITRNDRPGWLPLTGRAPARFYAFHLPNYVGQCGGRGGVFIVSFTISPLFDRTNERGPCPPLSWDRSLGGRRRFNETEHWEMLRFSNVWIPLRVYRESVGNWSDILRIDLRARLTFFLVSLVILDLF